MADMNTLNVLFENELRDVYDAEKQILKALPKIIKAVSNDDLRKALVAHLEERAVKSSASNRRSNRST